MARGLYTAEATVTGGRSDGHGRTSDGELDVRLRRPTELGGEGGGMNPEQLFAVGYAACFEEALRTVARRERMDLGEVSILSRVSLEPGEDRSFAIGVAFEGTLPAISDSDHAVALVAAAHRVCPYSERHPRQRRGGAHGERAARPLSQPRRYRIRYRFLDPSRHRVG